MGSLTDSVAERWGDKISLSSPWYSARPGFVPDLRPRAGVLSPVGTVVPPRAMWSW
jgi:hypothetical protein